MQRILIKTKTIIVVSMECLYSGCLSAVHVYLITSTSFTFSRYITPSLQVRDYYIYFQKKVSQRAQNNSRIAFKMVKMQFTLMARRGEAQLMFHTNYSSSPDTLPDMAPLNFPYSVTQVVFTLFKYMNWFERL